MSPCNLPYGLTLGRFLKEDPILVAMHHYERAWADLLCNDFQDWKQNVAELCAPALKEMSLHAPNDKNFTDPTPSRNASPLFTEPAMTRGATPLVEPAIFRPFTDPVAMEPAVERLFAAVRDSSPLTVSVAQLMASARNTPQLKEFTKPVAQLAEPVAKLFAAARSASPLFTEPIPAPVATVKHPYFATSTTIVPTDPSPFVPQAPTQAAGIKTIIARNLPRAITPEELRERFQLYGVVRDVYLPRNKDLNSPHYGTIRGFALIKYDTAAQSDRAVRVLSALGLSVRGKQVTVEFAKSDTAVRT